MAESARVSFVVTGGLRGVGRAIVERLQATAHVVVIDREPADATAGTPAGSGAGGPGPGNTLLLGDAGDPGLARAAADAAEELAPLTGWVNNAAVFDDAGLAETHPDEMLGLITANLRLAVTGTHTAVTHLLARGRSGSIVNVSSHQAQRAVRGALPYATAKAAIEGLTRAAAVDHGPDGIRVNAVALGSISTPRFAAYREAHPEVDAQMAALHPLGRIGSADEVARVVAFLLSEEAAFVSGVVLPVDGGRAAQGLDPESA